MEVKQIYAGLVRVEAKCIEDDRKESNAAQEKDPSKRSELNNDQWQSLIALHRQVYLPRAHRAVGADILSEQLLWEHHDFLSASQHPSAGPALTGLAAKYTMPARLWCHGIHAFLGILRDRLPDSLEYMITFIHIAYSMVALLYQIFPTFEDIWVEGLGKMLF